MFATAIFEGCRPHVIGAHNEALNEQAMSDADDSADDGDNQQEILAAEEDSCIVCMVAPSDLRLALVPCSHHRFCSSSADKVVNQGHRFPLCRSPMTMLLRLF